MRTAKTTLGQESGMEQVAAVLSADGATNLREVANAPDNWQTPLGCRPGLLLGTGCLCPPRIHVEALLPIYGIWRWSLWETVRSRGRNLTNGISALRRSATRDDLSPPHEDALEGLHQNLTT